MDDKACLHTTQLVENTFSDQGGTGGRALLTLHVDQTASSLDLTLLQEDEHAFSM